MSFFAIASSPNYHLLSEDTPGRMLTHQSMQQPTQHNYVAATSLLHMYVFHLIEHSSYRLPVRMYEDGWFSRQRLPSGDQFHSITGDATDFYRRATSPRHCGQASRVCPIVYVQEKQGFSV